MENMERKEVLEELEVGVEKPTHRILEDEVPLQQRQMEAKIMWVPYHLFLTKVMVTDIIYRRKVDWRLIPILGILYSVAGLDRVNVSPPISTI